jgi:hypothetical protein
MAFSFFALLDDVASLLDDVASMSKDVATMTKVAGKKTAGILGDDLAVNAEKATGFASSRELPIIFKIAKGSFINKIILLPILFLLSSFLPEAVIPILLLGGTYLTYEGVEKIMHAIFEKNKASKSNATKIKKELLTIDKAKFEKDKIKSAIMVDFILSLEIIIIALSVVIDEPIKNQIVIVSIVSIIATIGVYGIVALIVRLDDMGLVLLTKGKLKITKMFGQLLVKSLPIIIKILIVVGTIAMLLVGGGIFLHNIHFLETIKVPIPIILKELILGVIVGVLVFGVVSFFKMIYKKVFK